MATASPLYKITAYYTMGMGLYGASRGFRSHYKYQEKKWVKVERLFGYRLLDTVGNGCFYVWPPFGLVGLFHLINRIHIRQMGWKTEDFPEEYKEFGYQSCCLSVF